MTDSEKQTSMSVLETEPQEPHRRTWDARRQAFRALHEKGCFVIPNPWDVGSARYLQHLGFPGLATTSAGFAFSQGLRDSDVAVSRDRSLRYIADIAGLIGMAPYADINSFLQAEFRTREAGEP
jgi:2-methylisocitrate lyase-like PEP mutase family enzyme